MKKTEKTVEVQAKEKLYNQFINRLLGILFTGFIAGGCILATFDYALGAQIPERSPFVVGFLVLSALICFVYWVLVFMRSSEIEGLRGLALFAAVIAFIACGTGGFSLYKNTENLRTYFYGEEIVIKDKKETAQVLIDYIETWRHTPNYCLTYISDEEFYVTVYNSEGESVTQLILDEGEESLTNIALCLTDGTAVIVGDDLIERRLDADNLTYVANALQWVIDGKATIERASTTNTTIPVSDAPPDAFPGTEYAIIIDGVENLRDFYAAVIGSTAADEMFQALMNTDISIMYNIVLEEAYIAVGSSIYIDGQGSLLWYIENYTEVYDWSLGTQDWYGYDFSDAEKNEKMVEEAMYNVTSMLEDFSADVGIDWEGFKNDEGAVDETVEQTDTGDYNNVGATDTRRFERYGQIIELYADGTFTASLMHDVHMVGFYSEAGDTITFNVDGVNTDGTISDETLIIPDAWDDGHSHGTEFSLIT